MLQAPAEKPLVKVRDALTGKDVCTLTGLSSFVSVRFSPDSKRVLSFQPIWCPVKGCKTQ